MGVSSDDSNLLRPDDGVSPGWANMRQEKAMKTAIKYFAPWLAVAGIGGAIVLAPIASADTDPSVPYGTEPHSPYILGFHESNHDEGNTTNGQVDTPF